MIYDDVIVLIYVTLKIKEDIVNRIPLFHRLFLKRIGVFKERQALGIHEGINLLYNYHKRGVLWEFYPICRKIQIWKQIR